jgi:N-acyl-D-aspartate/D-glutamate deacylase
MNLDLPKGIREAIRLGKETGIRVHIAHVTPLPQADPDIKDEEMAGRLLAIFDDAIAQGVDISFDVMPNSSGGGCITNKFAYLTKPWVVECGDVKSFLDRIENEDGYRQKVISEMQTSAFINSNINANPASPDVTRIIRSDAADFENKTIREIMNERGWSFEDAILNILKADPKANIKIFFTGASDKWLNTMLSHHACIPSSDGFSYNKNSNIDFSEEVGRLPHPNNFCYTIRYLTTHRLARLEDNIRQMTGYAAKRFSILDRGLIRAGLMADLVVLNENELRSNESFVDSRVFPDGVEYVLINGAVTGEHKKHTGAKKGMILKR